MKKHLRTKPTISKPLGVIIHSTTLAAVGDSTPRAVQPFMTENYGIRHVVFGGQLAVSFPNSSRPDEVSDPSYPWVWPKDSNYTNITEFTAIALAADTMFYCVCVGTDTDVDVRENISVQGGCDLIIPMGTIAFVLGNDYSVAGTTYSAKSVFAVESAGVTLTANSAVRVTLINLTVPEYEIINP